MAVMQAGMSQDLAELAARARVRFEALSPSGKLRHCYMQRRSFARSFARNLGASDERMPHEAGLTDTQIGLILAGEPWRG